MMKFKVGDRVMALPGRYTGLSSASRYNLPRHAGVVHRSGDGFIEVEYDGVVSPPVSPASFELASSGPTRKRTVTEIVPGVYGRVKVGPGSARKNIAIAVTGPTIAHEVISWSLTATELTDAIATLTAIRDALAEVA